MNDTTNLNKKYDQNNNLNAVQTIDTPSGANLDYIANNQLQQQEEYKTKLEQDTNLSREQALQDVIAGLPTIQSPSITISPTKPDLDKADISKSFTVRDEVMSKLGLMDENYNYTDTYTNYIQQGGAPLPGYEYAHQELLDQERYDQIFQQQAEGQMTYDQALMEAYGKDILATMGYDVTSVAYWQNKFYNNDFSHPFNNRYLMDQVKQAANNYHQARLAGEYAHTNVKESTLQNLVGKEIDEELSASEIKNLFNMDNFKDNLADDDFFKALHTGQIGAESRMMQGSDGTYYYLHTDGRLYKLDGQQGDGHGTLKMNGDEFEGIDLNNNGLISFGRSTFTGFTGVFTGIVDLGAIATQSLGALVTLGYGDGFDSDDFFGWSNSFDAWLNDDAAWLVDSGYIDLSSDISTQDIFNFTGSMIGTIAGTMTLAGIVGSVGDAGSVASKGSGLMGWGERLTADGHKIAGSFLKGTGTVLKWQTGNIGTNTGAMGGLFTKSQWLNGSNLQVWGRRVGAAAVANTKNMLNDTRKNIMVAHLYDEGASDLEIFKRSAVTNVINLGIDTLISGGMDDNQWQAWFGTDAGVFGNKAQKAWSQEINKMLTKGTSDVLKQELDKNVKGTLKKYLVSKACVIGFNSAADFAGNMLTGAMSNLSGIDRETGKLKDFSWKNFQDGFTPEAVARSAVNTLWYSTRSQIKDWNAGLETIGRSHTLLMTKFDNEIKDAKGNPAKQKALLELKNKYIADLNKGVQKGTDGNTRNATTYEGRILYAMDQLSEGLKKQGEDVPEILKSCIQQSVSEESRSRLEKIYTYGESIYAAKLNRIETLGNPAADNAGLLRKILHPLRTTKDIAKWATGVKGSNEAVEQQEAKNEMFNATIASLHNTIVNPEYIDYITKAENVINNSIDTKDLVSETGYTMSKKNSKLFKKLQKVDPTAANNQYLYLPQYKEGTVDLKAQELALDISSDLGYLKKIDVGGEYVYQLQPYFDQIDYLNASTVNQVIHKSILALTTNASVEEKADIITNLSKTLMDTNVSDVQKSGVIASILKTMQTRKGPNSKQFLKPSEATKIFLELQNKGYINNVNLKNFKDLKANDAFSYLATAGDIALKIQKDKGSQIDLTDPLVQKVISDWKDSGDISQEDYNKLMKIQRDNPQDFQNGSLVNKAKYIKSQIDGQFKDMLPEDSDLSRLQEGSTPEEIALWCKEFGHFEGTQEEFEKSELYKAIMDYANEYDKVTSSGKTISIGDDNIVYVDLDTFRGKATNDFTKRILSIGSPNIRNIGNSNEYKEFESGLFKDLQTRNKYIKMNSSIQKFDLQENPQQFIDFMKEFGYDVKGNTPTEIKQSTQKIQGLKNFIGNTIVLDVPRVKDIENLRKTMDENANITIGNKTYSLKNIVYEDLKGNSLQDFDFDRAIMDQVEIKNIDPRIQVILKQTPLLQLIPFEQPVDGKYDYTMPIASAMLGDVENLRKMSGKLAGQTGKDLTYLLKKSAGSPVKYNANLENYFILDLLVTNMFDQEYTNFKLAREEVDWLRENKLADDSRKNVKNNPNNIWTIVGKADNAYLKLKDGITKEKVMDYVLSEDFDIHRLLPVQLKEINEQGKQGIIDAFATHTTKGTEEMLPGLARETGFNILNVRLPWDDGNNSRYLKFLNSIIDNPDAYNPIEGSGFTKHTTKTFDSFNDWYENAKDSTDPYDIITKMYVDEFNNMVHQSDSDEYENHTLLVSNRSARKILLEAIGSDTEVPKATQELVDRLKAEFEPITNGSRKVYSNASKVQGYSSIPGYHVGSAAEPDEAYVSSSRLMGAMGGEQNIEVKSDIDWIDLKTVQDALDLIFDIKSNEENSYRQGFFDHYVVSKYEEDDALKLFKGAVGDNGYIPIQDVDEYANLLAENYRLVMDGTDRDFQLKTSMIPAAKELWGKDYNKVVDEIFKQAKSHIHLAEKQLAAFQAHVKNNGPTAELNEYSTIDYLPVKDNGEYQVLKGRENMNRMEEYIKNSLDMKENDREEKFNNLMSTSDGLLDNEMYDSLTNRIREDRNLYTSAPYASDVEKYSYAHNAIGQMKTTVNTFKELKNTFKDASDEELMHTAFTLVNLHQGVEYAGDTANYIIVKNGSLKDGNVDLMDKYASVNMNDLLFNIHKAEKELKGCTIIKANSQGIENVAALKMSYMNLDNQDTFDNFVSDLYKHFIAANAYTLKDKTMSVDQLQHEIFGGSVNVKNIQEMLNKIPAERMSSIQRNKKIYDVYRERAEVTNISKGEFYSMMKGTDSITMNTMARDAMINSVDFDEAYKTNRNGIANLVNLQFGLGNVDNMTPERRNIIKAIKEDISNLKTADDAKLSPAEQAEQIILKDLVDREDAPSIDYLVRNRSLVNMKQEVDSNNIKNGFVINIDDGKPTRIENTKDLTDLVKSIETNDSTIETKYNKIVSFDDETSLQYKADDYDKSIFNVGVNIRTKTDNGWDTKHYNIFVNYESDNMTEAERAKFRDSWIKENVLEAKDRSFYDNNKGYRDTVEIYKNIYDHIDDNTLYLKPSEIKEFFAQNSGEGSILLGYNTSNADIPWMLKANMFDDDLLSKYTHVDVKVLGDVSHAPESTTSGKKDIRAENYGLETLGAHSGEYDADVTADLFLKTVNTTFNIASVRNYIYKDLMKNPELQKLGLSEDQLQHVLKNIDNKIKTIQDNHIDLKDYFDYDKAITTDTITAATDIFEYMINKTMANTSFAIRDQQIMSDYLSDQAVNALVENKQSIVNKMWAFAKENGVAKKDLLNSLRIEMKYSGTGMNSLLETLNNDARINRVLDRIGLDSSKFNNDIEGIKLFDTRPDIDPDLDSEQFRTYNTLRNKKDLVDTFHNITSSIKFLDDNDMRDFVNELGTIYEFREGLTPQDYFKDDIQLINTKVSEMYKEYLLNNYGDVDAVMAQSKKGIYDMVDALPVGTEINNGTGTKVIADSSMIVLSKSQFRNLMGRDYNPATDTELYSQLLIHPADANNKILPRKIVVDTDLKGNYMLVPETLIETLGSRDFDGDHLILLKPDDYTQDVLSIYTNEMYKIHDTQENVLSFLRQQGVYYDDSKEKNLILNTIGKNEEVIEACRKADALLEQGKEISEDATNAFINLVKEIVPDISDKTLDKVLKDLWITEKVLYEDTGDTTPIRYINNPAIYAGTDREVTLNGKQYTVPLSFSGQERLRAEDSQLVNKYLYNFIDQTTGVTEKYAINNLKNQVVNNPWTDLLASGIYGSNTVYKYFTNIDGNNEEIRNGLKGTILESISKQYRNTPGYSDIKNIAETSTNQMLSELKSNDNIRAFNTYDLMLRRIEETQRKSIDAKSLMEALTSDKMQEKYNIMKQNLEKTEKNIVLANELKKTYNGLPQDTYYGDVTNYSLNSLINKLATEQEGSFNKNIFKDVQPVRAFVITRFGDSETPIGIGEDSILVNNNKPKEQQLCGYTKRTYQLSDKDKLANIEEGKIYERHTKLTKGNKPIELDRLSMVVRANKDAVTVMQVDYLDNGFKMATDIGGKGVVNSLYGTDADVDILLNKPDPRKLSLGSDIAVDTTEVPITLTYKGKKITAYGFYTDAKPIVTEDTHAWDKNNARNFDALHVVMDANTLNGVLDLGATFENGVLKTNPEKYAELRNSVYKQHNDVQIRNFLGTYNRAKISYIINRLSDEELQKAFNTDIDADKLRYNLTNNMYLATDKYTSIAYTLGKKFSDRIDDELGQRLFSDYGLHLLGKDIRSRATGTNPYGAHSKNDIAAQTNINEDGTTNLSTYKGRIVHLSPDEMNAGKGMTNHEDYYLSPYDFFDLVTGGTSKINSYNIKQMLKDGSLPYQTFITGTANMENNWRNWSSMYTTEDPELQRFIPQSPSRKTGLVTTKADVVGYNPVELSLKVPERNEIINTRQSGFSDEIISLIDSGETNLAGNYANLANMLYRLQNLNPKDSLEQKKLDLSNTEKLFRTYDSHFAVQYDEDGNPNIALTKNVPVTGNLKELMNATKNAVFNYATFNAIKNKNVEEEKLDAKVLDSKIDKPKQRKTNYKKELDSIWGNMKNDFLNTKTGEVKEGFDISEYNTESKVAPARILSGGETSVLEKSVWGRQGLKEDTKLGAELTVALKNQAAGNLYIQQEPMRILQNFKQIAMSRMSDEEIKDYTICQSIFQTRGDGYLEQALKYHGYNSIDEVASKLQNYKELYPEVETAFKQHLDSLTNLSNVVAKETGEPLGKCLMGMIAPYKSTNVDYNKAKAVATIKNALGLQKYNPISDVNKQASTLEFDLWNSSESIIQELSKMHSAKVIKDTLISKDMLKNDSLLDGVSSLLDKVVDSSEEKQYIKQSDEQKQIQQQTLNVIQDLTGIKFGFGSGYITFKQYKDIYNNIDSHLKVAREQFYQATGKEDLKSYTDFERASQDSNETLEFKNSAKAVANFYYAKMICGQAMIQSTPDFAKRMGAYIESLKQEGYSLANAYGQKYVKGGVLNPLSSSSMANLVENMEIAYNSYDDTRWNQFILEKIISGDVYLIRNDIADHIESHAYTTKMPGNTMKVLKEISKWSSALQMALPSKILNRVISFTGFDYSMGIMYDPNTIKYMGPARRELLAAFQSKGTQMSDELKEYMMREGQPIGLTGKDPITFTEDISGPDKVMRVLNTLTDPLEFQNHLGRYAIYLAAKESFDNGKPNYGPLYYAKDAVDALDNNADKAMMVMDYILGSPGGFPELSRKTSGLMLYATFPMNFGRTMGAYGMSLGRLFKEGFTNDNADQWLKTAVVPSMGLAGVTGLSMLLTAWICDLFGIEEDEKEKMVKDLSTIDIVGTVVSGSPQKSGSSMNPLENVNEMFIEPFTNPYNKTLLEKLFGFVNTNVTSHLNPAIKAPVEIASGYDIYGNSLMNTKYQYNNIENGLRKVMGFFIGSNTANALVDQYKMDKYNDDSTFLSTLMEGARRGITSSLGNQKTYKRDLTNYYNRLNDIKNYKYKFSGETYSEEVEDYIEADSMERIRSSKSRYGSYNNDDYQEMNNMMRKMMRNKVEPSTVYAYIISKYNEGVSERTIKSVLNNHSIIRKLESIDKQDYLSTLNSKEYSDLLRAMTYENEYYPLLQKLFPNKEELSTYLPKRTKYYKKSSGGGGSPKTYYPKRAPQVTWYPNNGYNNKKLSTKRPKASIERVEVKVSPEMAVWTKDYNKTKELNHWTDYDYNRVKPMSHGGGK